MKLARYDEKLGNNHCNRNARSSNCNSNEKQSEKSKQEKEQESNSQREREETITPIWLIWQEEWLQ